MRRSLPYLAWGVDFVDFNNDGWLDLFVANGHLDDNVAEIDPIGTYAQPNQLFLSNRGLNFVGAAVGAAIAESEGESWHRIRRYR